MKVAVDFSHALQMIDLVTHERKFFLVPTGMATPVEVEARTVQDLFELVDPPLADDLGQHTTRQPEAVASVTRAPEPVSEAPGVSLLSPGTVGEPVASSDVFHIEEG